MDLTVWNMVLTAALGLISWFAKAMWAEQQRLSILLNRTREELAKEYITRVDVHHDFARVMDRLDRLDSKIDELIKGSK